MSEQYINTVGTFECIVEKPEAGWFAESKEKKTQYLRIPVKVIEGPCAGQRGIWNGWLSDAAFDNTIARLTQVFGFNGDLTALHEGRVTLAGKRCSVSTESETYNGKPRVKVQWLNEPGGGGPKPLEETKVNALLSKLTARAKAIAKATKVAAPATPAPTPTASDDDVPF